MSDIENRLAESLAKTDEDFLRDLDLEQGFFSQLWSTFKGPLGFISVLVLVTAMVFVSLAIWFSYEAFQAESAKVTTLWVGGAVAAILGNGLLRMWLFNRMNQLVVLRAIKRVELLVLNLERKE